MTHKRFRFTSGTDAKGLNVFGCKAVCVGLRRLELRGVEVRVQQRVTHDSEDQFVAEHRQSSLILTEVQCLDLTRCLRPFPELNEMSYFVAKPNQSGRPCASARHAEGTPPSGRVLSHFMCYSYPACELTLVANQRLTLPRFVGWHSLSEQSAGRESQNCS